MNQLAKSGALIIAIAAMLSGACKKEAHDSAQADSANPVANATAIQTNAGYVPAIIGSISQPRGYYRPADMGQFLPYDFKTIKLDTLAPGLPGKVRVTVNQHTFQYELNTGDEIFSQGKLLPLSSNGVVTQEITVTAVDKAQTSQIKIRYWVTFKGTYSVKEIAFTFDGMDKAPSVVEYNSLYWNTGCIMLMPNVLNNIKQGVLHGIFYGIAGYRAGAWGNKSPMTVSGFFYLDPPKM